MAKKLLFLIVTMIAVLSTFTSCSSDDDDKNPLEASIIGTWVNSDNGITEQIQYKADGSCIETISLNESSMTMRDTGNYRLDGNKLTIHWATSQGWNPITESWIDLDDPEETVVITISIDGNKLTYLSMEGEEKNNPVVFIRK